MLAYIFHFDFGYLISILRLEKGFPPFLLVGQNKLEIWASYLRPKMVDLWLELGSVDRAMGDDVLEGNGEIKGYVCSYTFIGYRTVCLKLAS